MAAMDMHDIIEQIDKHLAPYGARKLSSKEIQNYTHYAFGWCVNAVLERSSTDVTLALLFNSQYPDSKPAIFLLHPNHGPLEYPHIESNGKLCVWPSGTIVDT